MVVEPFQAGYLLVSRLFWMLFVRAFAQGDEEKTKACPWGLCNYQRSQGWQRVRQWRRARL